MLAGLALRLWLLRDAAGRRGRFGGRGPAAFFDGPVGGLEYRTETIVDVTGPDGSFRFKPGETVIFSIGGIVLGRAPAAKVMTPLDLVGGTARANDAEVLNICRLLQTLDDDADPGNGIQISNGVRNGAQGLSFGFRYTPDQFGQNGNVVQTVAALTRLTRAGQRPLVPAPAAMRQFMAGWSEGHGRPAVIILSPGPNQRFRAGQPVSASGYALYDALTEPWAGHPWSGLPTTGRPAGGRPTRLCFNLSAGTH